LTVGPTFLKLPDMAEHPSILVAGAGPTGLTAAVELARLGHRPRIVDRNEGPTPLSKAVGISAHSLELLEPSGVTGRLLAEGLRIPRGHVHAGGRELGTIRFSDLPHRFNFLLALPQSDTETILAEVLAGFGVTVERRTTLAGLRQAGGRVEVVLEGPGGREEAPFDTVYGADGVGSRVRESLGVAFEGYDHARDWSIADAELADWPYEEDTANLFLQPGGEVGFIIPIGPGRFRAISNTPDALARIPGGYRVVRLLRSDRFHIQVRQATTYQSGRVFLGGDAAHVHSPVGGRGMNLGIEDACAFARHFTADDREQALDGYTAERHPAGQRWIAASERALAAVEASNPFAVALRNLAIRAVGRLTSLQRPLLRRAAGLDG
jgi:2-polyprenyl-6-methoxyphenol hydroxylase-like FAD-dependent oxidoreductase